MGWWDGRGTAHDQSACFRPKADVHIVSKQMMTDEEAMALTLSPPVNFGIPKCTVPDIAILNFQIFFYTVWAGIHASFELNPIEGKDHYPRNEGCIYPESLVLLNVGLVLFVVLVKHHITANQWPLDLSPFESPLEGSTGLQPDPVASAMASFSLTSVKEKFRKYFHRMIFNFSTENAVD